MMKATSRAYERGAYYELGVQYATIAELRRQLTTACRQWKMYAEMQEDRDLADEQSHEADLYRRAFAATREAE
jgi:hypothetical protein